MWKYLWFLHGWNLPLTLEYILNKCGCIIHHFNMYFLLYVFWLMMRSVVASHQKLTRTNWEQSLKLIFHNYMRICSRIQCWPSIVIQLLKQIEWVSESHSVMPNSLWPHGLYSLWNSPGQNTRVGSLSLLQGIFPTNGSNSGLLHYRQILYHLRHQGSPCLSTQQQILDLIVCLIK